jgi:hypothetical protein
MAVLVAAPVGLHSEAAGVRSTLTDGRTEPRGAMAHAQRQMRRMRDPRRGDVHAVFSAPVRWSIPEVPLHVAPQPLRVHAWGRRQVPVTAPQDDLGAGGGAQGGLGEEDDLQRVRVLLLEPWPRVHAGLAIPRHGGLFEVLDGEVGVLHLGTIRATGTSPGLGAGGGLTMGDFLKIR